MDAEDHVYVTDRENHRVQKFTSDGQYVFEFGNLIEFDPTTVFLPEGITVDAEGNIYIVDGWYRVIEYTADGAYHSQFGGPRRRGRALQDTDRHRGGQKWGPVRSGQGQ